MGKHRSWRSIFADKEKVIRKTGLLQVKVERRHTVEITEADEEFLESCNIDPDFCDFEKKGRK